MKFTTKQYSPKHPPIECVEFVIHEPATMALTKPFLRGTAAALVLPSGQVFIGVALCSDKEQFVRAVGRQKAIGRAYSQVLHNAPHMVDIKLPDGVAQLKIAMQAAIMQLRHEVAYMKGVAV